MALLLLLDVCAAYKSHPRLHAPAKRNCEPREEPLVMQLWSRNNMVITLWLLIQADGRALGSSGAGGPTCRLAGSSKQFCLA